MDYEQDEPGGRYWAIVVPCALIAFAGIVLQWLWDSETPAWGPFELVGFFVAGVVAVAMVARDHLRD